MNPQETAEELIKRSEHDGLAVLMHPNCPVDLWYSLAQVYAYQAPLSPMYDLVLLEDPGHWEQFEKSNASFWIRTWIHSVKISRRSLFQLEVAAHFLPLYERAYPGDTLMRQLVQAHYHCRILPPMHPAHIETNPDSHLMQKPDQYPACRVDSLTISAKRKWAEEMGRISYPSYPMPVKRLGLRVLRFLIDDVYELIRVLNQDWPTDMLSETVWVWRHLRENYLSR
jgi:hypothetical protein